MYSRVRCPAVQASMYRARWSPDGLGWHGSPARRLAQRALAGAYRRGGDGVDCHEVSGRRAVGGRGPAGALAHPPGRCASGPGVLAGDHRGDGLQRLGGRGRDRVVVADRGHVAVRALAEPDAVTGVEQLAQLALQLAAAVTPSGYTSPIRSPSTRMHSVVLRRDSARSS